MAEPDFAALDDRALRSYLAELEEDERRVSRRRRRLHEQIDFVAAGMYADAAGSGQRLAELQAEERQVSDERRALHRLIDEVRTERERRTGGSGLDAAA